jgi:hypothetical protein
MIMKKQLFKYLLATLVFIAAAVTSNAQVRLYVKVRPTAVVVERPVAPHPNYVWIDEEWTVQNGAYVHVPGYWAEPRPGYVWVPGHWTSEAKGDYWVPGHWKRV